MGCLFFKLPPPPRAVLLAFYGVLISMWFFMCFVLLYCSCFGLRPPRLSQEFGWPPTQEIYTMDSHDHPQNLRIHFGQKDCINVHEWFSSVFRTTMSSTANAEPCKDSLTANPVPKNSLNFQRHFFRLWLALSRWCPEPGASNRLRSALREMNAWNECAVKGQESCIRGACMHYFELICPNPNLFSNCFCSWL